MALQRYFTSAFPQDLKAPYYYSKVDKDALMSSQRHSIDHEGTKKTKS